MKNINNIHGDNGHSDRENINKFEALLMDYLDGALSNEQAQWMALQEQSNSECSALASQMRLLLQDLSMADDSVTVPTDWQAGWREAIRSIAQTAQKEAMTIKNNDFHNPESSPNANPDETIMPPKAPKRNIWQTIGPWVGAAAAIIFLMGGAIFARDYVPVTGTPPGTNNSQATNPSVKRNAGSGNAVNGLMETPSSNGFSAYSGADYESDYGAMSDYEALYDASDAGGSLNNFLPMATSAPKGPSNNGNDNYQESHQESAVSDADSAQEAGERKAKIIKTLSYSLATSQFDDDLNAIKNLTEVHNGWIEYSYERGDVAKGEKRYANLTLRIPTAAIELFESGVGSIGRVTSSNQTTTDASENYYDIMLRLETQQQKLTRLNKLLETAGELSDLLALENEIANTQYQIDSYQNQIQGIDNRVNYTSVDIYLSEEGPLEQSKEDITLTLGQRIQKGIEATISNIKAFLQDMAVFIVMALPVIIPIVILITIIALIIKKRKNKNKK